MRFVHGNGELAMDRHSPEESESRFASFVEGLSEALGHRDRAGPLRDYCAGLLSGCERKSVEPLAAITAPARVSAQHQSLLHFVGKAPWSDEAVLTKLRELTMPVFESHGGVEAWIIDDTGFPKKGKHSVGVARQYRLALAPRRSLYCGQLGKQDNCQAAVSLSIANRHASLPIAYRLYLPQEWVDDEQRRLRAGVPEDVAFRTKPEIALEQIAQALKDGVQPGVVLMDAGYGVNTALRDGVTALGLSYVAGVLPQTSVWMEGTGPLPPKPPSGLGRPPKLLRRDKEHQPISVKELALGLPGSDWKTVAWRQGACETLSSRFARLHVRPAHRDYNLTAPKPEEWLLIEWPEGEAEPAKYWLSTLPQDTNFASLVDTAKLRWRIERDYLDLKQEIGIGHYEGRGWRGFHHHATLCIAAYAFLISERETIPPSATRAARGREKAVLPKSYRPRGYAAQAGEAHPELHRNAQAKDRSRLGQKPAAMPLLRRELPNEVVTQ
jgi:SRSO17 transposase